MSALTEFKCPSCGGGLQFEAKGQVVICPYCSSEFDVETIEAFNKEAEQESDASATWENDTPGTTWQEGEGEDEHLAVYSCGSCGGEVVCEPTTAAAFCPYCENPIVIKGQLSGTLKPDYIIPFKCERESIQTHFAKYVKGKLLLHRDFKKECKTEEIKGMYVPFWIYDADVNAHMRFHGERVHTWSDSEYTYTETSHYSIVRGGTLSFEHIPVDGSQKMPDDMMESIEPYDFNDAVPFKAPYLTGFYADKHDVDQKDTFPRANQRIEQGTEAVFRDTIGAYSSVNCVNRSIHLTNSKASYALYPVWMIHKRWKEKLYTFVMNGQTGKIAGNLPMNVLAFVLWLVGISLLATGILIPLVHAMLEEYSFSTFFIAAAFGCAIGLGVALTLKRQLKTIRKKHGASDYFCQDSLCLTEKSDSFLYRTVRKVKRASSNSNRKD